MQARRGEDGALLHSHPHVGNGRPECGFAVGLHEASGSVGQLGQVAAGQLRDVVDDGGAAGVVALRAQDLKDGGPQEGVEVLGRWNAAGRFVGRHRAHKEDLTHANGLCEEGVGRWGCL